MTPLPTLHRRRLRELYREMAPRYPTIAPVTAALTAHLFERVSLQRGNRVLDLGTGAGTAAGLAATRGCRVVGVDISRAMLSLARHGVPAARFVCADVHHLPFACAAFDAVLAAFCFNETDPTAAFAETHRVLKPGGRLALLEWGPVDALMALVDAVLAEYAVTTAQTPAQAEMRALAAQVRPWDEAVEDGDDIVALLEQAGFVEVTCEVVHARVPFATAEAFLSYALAWPTRCVEVDAMPAPERARFYHDVRARLGEGEVMWAPVLLGAGAGTPHA